jgi:glycosyltransferase involved in cell wall biosynthesis
MNRGPLVSVIIPTYNRASLICDAIDSVSRQTYPHVEIIVVDDGSTDDTQGRLAPYRDRVRVIAQENAGPAVARNKGLEAAGGEIVAWLDSDDTWLPTKLERQVDLMRRAGPSVPCCLCNASMLFPDGGRVTTFEYAGLSPSLDEGLWSNVAEIFATRFVLFAQTAAIRREVIDRIGGFDEELRFHEDHEFPLRLALEGAWAFVREPLVLWRQDSPGSYAAMGQANEVALKGCAVQMWESLSATVDRNDGHRHLRRLFRQKLRESRRELWATRWVRDASWPYAVAGGGMLRLDRYRRAVHRRSPGYPRMETSRVTS